MKASLFQSGYIVRPAALALVLCCFLPACKEDDRNQQAVQAAIEKEIANRVSIFRESRQQRCYEQALEEASRLADSILIEEARLERDTIGRPPIPAKPERPEIKTLLDSVPIAPLLRAPAPPDTTDSTDGR